MKTLELIKLLQSTNHNSRVVIGLGNDEFVDISGKVLVRIDERGETSVVIQSNNIEKNSKYTLIN